ncbi:unnamed protein product [Mesocestoides corti]|uniref:RanBP2-type domain-containing protein n=1 Tax=Mesocestoides corti TaxID=53468 RepID=A0A0R3UGF1_MESCO|nr:unnamed protein product [Mesocestoides corti]
MHQFSRSETSTPGSKNDSISGRSPNNGYDGIGNSPFYFSRLFSSPISRPTVPASPISPQVSLRRGVAMRQDLPPSLLNFQSPIRRQFKPHQPGPSRPRHPVEFLAHSSTSMMERALWILESKRKKRSGDSETDDSQEANHDQIKRHKRSDQNDCEPVSPKPEATPQQEEAVRPTLKPVTTSTRPSSAKLPDHVSRLSSATLEALAFGGKRPRTEDHREVAASISSLDDYFSSPMPPAAKRRDTRDCETQTTVDRTTSPSPPPPRPTPKQPPRVLKTSSVSRFIAGLEARARANALIRRTTAPALVLAQSNSLESRHANIRRLFSDLAEKASSLMEEPASTPTTGTKIVPGATSPSQSITTPAASSPVSLPFTSTSTISLPKISESAPLSSAPSILPSTIATVTTSISSTPSFTSSEEKLPKSGPKPVTTSDSLSFVAEKPKKSTESSAAVVVTTMSTSVEPKFVFSLEKKSTSEQTSSGSGFSATTTSFSSPFLFGKPVATPSVTASTSNLTPPVVSSSTPKQSVSGNAVSSLSTTGGFVFSSTNTPTASTQSSISVVQTTAAPAFTFSLMKTASSETAKTEGTVTTAAPSLAVASTTTPIFNFTASSKSESNALGATTTSVTTPSAAFNFSASTSSVNSSAPPLAFQVMNKPTVTTTPSFNFSSTSQPSSSTNLTGFDVAKTATSSGSLFTTTKPAMSGFNFSATATTTTAQTGFTFPSTTTAAAPSSMFNFSLKPSAAVTTVSSSLNAPVTTSTPSLGFPATTSAIQAAKTSSIFGSPAVTTTNATTTFNFSAKPSSTTATTTAPLFNFTTTVTTASPSLFNFPSSSTASTTSSIGVNPSFSFPAASSNAVTNGVGSAFTTSASQFTIPKTSAPSLFKDSGSVFAAAVTTVGATASPFVFQNTSSTTGVKNGGPFAFQSPASSTAAPVSTSSGTLFNFPASTASGGFNFSATLTTTTGSSAPFAPKPASTVGSAFQFGATAASTTTASSSGFAFGLTSAKSSPSLFSVDHAKRSASSTFSTDSTGPGMAKISGQSTPGTFGSTSTSTPFGGAPAAGNQPFAFGAASGATDAAAGSGGFNFGNAATSFASNGAFNFGQTALPFSQGSTPNPFNVASPSTPNAAASFQQRRRQMRLTKRR